MTNIVKSEQAVIQYTQEQINLIKSVVAPKATDNELQLFLYQCQRTGLDPLTRQIYCIHRKVNNVDKMTIQTSIDGFRVIAERSGVYAGQSEPVFVEENGKIICCKVSVFKFSASGQRYEAAVGVAYWSEYVQNTPLWTKMPHTMISKCAEAVALRKAFPQDLSGIYTSDEMDQSSEGEDVQEAVVVGSETKTTETKQLEAPKEIKPLNPKWQESINAITTRSALVEFYNKNKGKIDADDRLKKMMHDRREQLPKEQPQTQTA